MSAMEARTSQRFSTYSFQSTSFCTSTLVKCASSALSDSALGMISSRCCSSSSSLLGTSSLYDSSNSENVSYLIVSWLYMSSMLVLIEIQKVYLIGKSDGWLVYELNFETVRTVQQQLAKQMILSEGNSLSLTQHRQYLKNKRKSRKVDSDFGKVTKCIQFLITTPIPYHIDHVHHSHSSSKLCSLLNQSICLWQRL